MELDVLERLRIQKSIAELIERVTVQERAHEQARHEAAKETKASAKFGADEADAHGIWPMHNPQAKLRLYQSGAFMRLKHALRECAGKFAADLKEAEEVALVDDIKEEASRRETRDNYGGVATK